MSAPNTASPKSGMTMIDWERRTSPSAADIGFSTGPITPNDSPAEAAPNRITARSFAPTTDFVGTHGARG